jgi:hypothetical protein
MQLPTEELGGPGDELPDALRRAGMSEMTGWLYVGSHDWSASLFLEAGRIRLATFRSREGLEAVTELASMLPASEYIFETERPAPTRRTLNLSVGELLSLLELARSNGVVDEGSELASVVPQLLLPLDGPNAADTAYFSPAMQKTLRDIDGRRTVAQIVAFRDSRAVLGHLKMLVDLGLISLTRLSANTPARAPVTRLPVLAAGVCPLLGLATEPASHLDRPSSGHSCFASGRPVALALMQQRSVCLTGSHLSCPLLAAATVASASDAEVAMIGSAGDVTDRTTRTWVPRRIAGLMNPRIMQAALALATLIVVTVGANVVISHLRNAASAEQTSSIATVAPTLVPTPAATPEPVDVPPPPPASVPALVNPRTFLHDTFSDNSQNWPNTPQGVAWLQPGGYVLATRQAGQFVALAIPRTEVFGDVTLRATFTKLSGLDGGGYGFILRDQGPGPRDGANQNGRYYVVEVGDKGQVGVWRRDSDHWTDVLPWTDTGAARQGEATNQLEVRSSGDRMTVSVNGVDVQTVTDGALPYGGVGLFVGGDQNQVLVQDLTVLAPGASS